MMFILQTAAALAFCWIVCFAYTLLVLSNAPTWEDHDD